MKKLLFDKVFVFLSGWWILIMIIVVLKLML